MKKPLVRSSKRRLRELDWLFWLAISRSLRGDLPAALDVLLVSILLDLMRSTCARSSNPLYQVY